MNIIVFSDTHGDFEIAESLYRRLSKAMDFDLLIHCGDHRTDGRILSERFGLDCVTVPGNCDGCRKRAYQIVKTPAGKILVTHGHAEGVKYGLENLYYLAAENECTAACFGHTHMAVNEVEGGIRLINPGSTSRPRDGSKGSCAIIVATERSLAASLVYV
jgi:putative phosphoesterase